AIVTFSRTTQMLRGNIIKFNWNYNQSPVTASPYRDIPLVSKLGNDLSSDLVMAGRILEGLDITPENNEMRAMLLKFIDSAGSDQNLVKLPDNQSLLQNPQERFQLQLAQNYPNPMNPETWIPFSLSDDSDVTVKIYNLSGSLVRTLDLGQRPAGDYSDKLMAAYWDGKDENGNEVASGAYLYQLQAGPATQTRKMIVLK
ncbi:MAG: FlgD immunoglobulin-like domain containing protein, partial [bacterium]|nr:FlgD immunoglobulin-like domain containing protein [bacterium]